MPYSQDPLLDSIRYNRLRAVDSSLSSVHDRTLVNGPNWGFLIGLALCIEVWVLVGVALAAFT